MHTLKFEDYECIFEYDTEEEFDKKLEVGIKTYERLQSIKVKNRINETLEKWSEQNGNSWYEIEAKFIQSIKNKNITEFIYKSYASTFKKLQEFFLYRSISLNIYDYDAFIEFLKNQDIGNGTINEYIEDINLFLDFAYKNNFIEQSVVLKQVKKSFQKKNTQEYMEKIHSKQILTVQELEDRFSIKKTTQQVYRTRLYNPLPYHQKVKNGKITYVVDEVVKWLENGYK